MLANDVSWIVSGSSPIAGTYTSRDQFIAEAIQPIGAKLSRPIRPTVQKIIAEGDTVVVLWDGHATAIDGRPYDNQYCWLMRIGDGKVKEAVAFFDSPMLTDLWQRTGEQKGES